jgi:hypothetical protein
MPNAKKAIIHQELFFSRHSVQKLVIFNTIVYSLFGFNDYVFRFSPINIPAQLNISLSLSPSPSRNNGAV